MHEGREVFFLVKTTDRNSFMDLYRFVGMLVVMGCHQYHLGVGGFPFNDGWIFAEFFFILTGYLTASHFYANTEEGSKLKKAFGYTIRKFKAMMPFIWGAIILEYAFQALKMYFLSGASAAEILSFLSQLPFEMLMLTGLYTQPVLVPGWYLSAMFLVFPALCILLQVMNKRALTIVSILVPVMLYMLIGFEGNWTFPDNLARALSGLLLGVLAFQMNQTLLAGVYRRLHQSWITLIQLICLLFPLIVCYQNYLGFFTPILFCFVLGIAITMSGKSATDRIRSKALVYLGRISMPLYLFHWTIAGVLISHRIPLSRESKYIVFHILAILFAICAYELHRSFRSSLARKVR